jgi:threonine dehydrogenase-like Zn-dependent dehydrogenase
VRRPGTCAYCRVGEVSFCPVGDYSEHGILKLHGFASDFAISDANYLVKIPLGLQKGAVLLEPMSVVEKAVTEIFLAQKRMTWMAKRALVLGAGPLGLLAAMLLRLRGLEVVCGATRAKDSLKANIVQTVGATYVNLMEKPLRSIEGKFDLIIEATGNVGVAIESLFLLASNGVLCLLGVYRDIQACEDFGKVLTNIVLGNRLVMGSVNSDKIHFEMGIEDMMRIKQKFGNILEKMLTANLLPEDFHKAFSPDKEDIKTVICFH